MGRPAAGLDLGGTFLPVTTPFDPVTGDVDVVAFRANLRHWLRSPIRGILVAGTTGEAALLDDDERLALLEAARDVVPADRLLLAGTGAESTRRTIRLCAAAAAAGADAVLVSPPAFFRGAMTPEALVRHFRAVADASPVPVLVYQVPLAMSTLDLPSGLVAELARHPNVVGIKDSRGKLEMVGELVRLAGGAEGFQVLVGSGQILYGALETGAVGGIVAVGLLATDAAAEIPRAYAEGRASDAGRLQERIAPLHRGIVAGLGVPGVKRALDLLGLRGGTPRPPLLPLAAERTEEVRAALAAADLPLVASAGAPPAAR
ncbi:MAG TPA: dihydrodipicolinate synthase family protein [Longimicrobiales bacterium]|nr:dihydrodipicolinate synthase family protein [Longimicrobiales bacterium]